MRFHSNNELLRLHFPISNNDSTADFTIYKRSAIAATIILEELEIWVCNSTQM